ncbi:hypothetical protein [Gordonia sp. CNJ-863]|uniref:hypothetical protein n=1 Tax=Gordonia sp. CNJ-863 TaxID=1904963 RepID=UPI00111522E3|nr:hypothetical protein [Gordonia sp. CNJ-863]
MAQFRPRRRERRDEPTATTTAAAGRQVSVAAGTAADLARADAGLVGERTPTDHLGTIGYDAACKAAQDAGRRPPSRRTFRRWKQQGRIPDDRTADLVARRAEITRMGGVDGAAQQLGRSPSAVYDWRAGRTKSLRPDARAASSMHRSPSASSTAASTSPACDRPSTSPPTSTPAPTAATTTTAWPNPSTSAAPKASTTPR